MLRYAPLAAIVVSVVPPDRGSLITHICGGVARAVACEGYDRTTL